MATKYYVTADGAYVGGFDGATPPDGAIEVPSPPEHGLDTWNNGMWQVSPQRLTAQAKTIATVHIAQIRAEMADHLVDLAIGNPSEQGTARAALGLLRAELAVEKAKL